MLPRGGAKLMQHGRHTVSSYKAVKYRRNALRTLKRKDNTVRAIDSFLVGERGFTALTARELGHTARESCDIAEFTTNFIDENISKDTPPQHIVWARGFDNDGKVWLALYGKPLPITE